VSRENGNSAPLETHILTSSDAQGHHLGSRKLHHAVGNLCRVCYCFSLLITRALDIAGRALHRTCKSIPLLPELYAKSSKGQFLALFQHHEHGHRYRTCCDTYNDHLQSPDPGPKEGSCHIVFRYSITVGVLL
jgi:hypothetical protein